MFHLELYFLIQACLIFFLIVTVFWSKWNIRGCCFLPLFIGKHKILRGIILLFDSEQFQSFDTEGKLTFTQLYWSMQGLIFDILDQSFPIFSQFSAIVTTCQKNLHYCYLDFYRFFYYSVIQENLCKIHQDRGLPSDTSSVIHLQCKIQIYYPSFMFPIPFIDISKPF